MQTSGIGKEDIQPENFRISSWQFLILINETAGLAQSHLWDNLHPVQSCLHLVAMYLRKRKCLTDTIKCNPRRKHLLAMSHCRSFLIPTADQDVGKSLFSHLTYIVPWSSCQSWTFEPQIQPQNCRLGTHVTPQLLLTLSHQGGVGEGGKGYLVYNPSDNTVSKVGAWGWQLRPTPHLNEQ